MIDERQSRYWDGLAPVGLDAAVIDPNDRLGHKNRYLATLRNSAVTTAIQGALEGPILDFGCGSGSLTEALERTGRPVIGADISTGLLARTRERAFGSSVVCLRYDGHQLPIMDATIAVIATYVVMTHIVDNDDLRRSLRECLRVLLPGGRLILVEQIRATPRDFPAAWKRQRSIGEYLDLLLEAGFGPAAWSLLRHGRSPWVQLARFGLCPSPLWSFGHKAERMWSALVGPVTWDYADALIVTHKPVSTQK